MIELSLYIILLGLLSSWEEAQQLVQRKSWNKDMFYSFLFWDTKWDGRWKLFDSHHIAFGMFILCTMMVLVNVDMHKFTLFLNQYFCQYTELAVILILWWFFFYIRNLGLHIILRRKSYRQWKYILPIQF
jgi:uncharacterized membrane protein